MAAWYNDGLLFIVNDVWSLTCTCTTTASYISLPCRDIVLQQQHDQLMHRAVGFQTNRSSLSTRWSLDRSWCAWLQVEIISCAMLFDRRSQNIVISLHVRCLPFDANLVTVLWPGPVRLGPSNKVETRTLVLPLTTSDRMLSGPAHAIGELGPDLQNILRRSYDYLTIMPKLRWSYGGRLIRKTSY